METISSTAFLESSEQLFRLGERIFLLPKRRIQETTDCFACVQSNLFRGVAQHGRQGDDGNKVDDEDNEAVHRRHEVKRNADRDGDQKNVDPGIQDGGTDLMANGERWRLPFLGVDMVLRDLLTTAFASKLAQQALSPPRLTIRLPAIKRSRASILGVAFDHRGSAGFPIRPDLAA